MPHVWLRREGVAGVISSLDMVRGLASRRLPHNSCLPACPPAHPPARTHARLHARALLVIDGADGLPRNAMPLVPRQVSHLCVGQHTRRPRWLLLLVPPALPGRRIERRHLERVSFFPPASVGRTWAPITCFPPASVPCLSCSESALRGLASLSVVASKLKRVTARARLLGEHACCEGKLAVRARLM